MRAVALVAWMMVGCGGQRSAPATAASAPQHLRCTLRLSPRGLFVDGERASREDAIAQCKQTSGAIVVIERDAPSGAWDATRAALEHEGVWFYVRGPICHGPYRDSCRPRVPVRRTAPVPPRVEPVRPKPVPALPAPSSSSP